MLPSACLIRRAQRIYLRTCSAQYPVGGVALSTAGKGAETAQKPWVSRRPLSSRTLRDGYYHEDEKELPWEAVENAAKEKIARHKRKNKNKIVIAGTDIMPGRKLRSSVVFEGIPRRRNVQLTGSRPERIAFCDRVITEELLHPNECRAIINAIQSAIETVLGQGVDVSVVPLQPSTEDIIGSYAYGLVLSALHRMRMELKEDHRMPQLYFAGALLSRLAVAGGSDDDPIPNTAYWNPHIDKANKKEYDYSAILYLNTQDDTIPPTTTSTSHFAGGNFIFLDADADRIIQPVAGRLVSFTSGFENPHQVAKVQAGFRFALSAWFTTDPKLAYDVQV